MAEGDATTYDDEGFAPMTRFLLWSVAIAAFAAVLIGCGTAG
jgi:hypothetical protein